jgi:hypothetical protein
MERSAGLRPAAARSAERAQEIPWVFERLNALRLTEPRSAVTEIDLSNTPQGYGATGARPNFALAAFFAANKIHAVSLFAPLAASHLPLARQRSCVEMNSRTRTIVR